MKRLARRLHRRFRSQRGNSGRKQTAIVPRLEQLEPRQMMAADGLAFAQSSIASANTLNTIPFVVEGNSQPVAISFHVHATGGSLDPATPQVLTSTGAVVPAMYSTSDYAGTDDGLLIVELAAGSYRIQIGGEQGSTGSFDLHAGLPGDTSGNGQVSKSEYQHVTAAVLQSHVGFTNISAQVFKKLGIDVSKNLYKSELDVNSNGKIDTFDQSIVEASVGASSVEVEFLLDEINPTITAALVGDTGRSNSDGITNNLGATINGTVSDAMPIASFTASIDGSTAVELGTLLGQTFTSGGNFSITRSQLEQIAGNVSVANNGSHTLLLTARDQQGNTSTRQVTFQFDTVAPAAPTALDLDAASDTGSSNSDNITRLQQLLLRADAESNSIVQFFSSLVTGSIGQGTASSPVSATTSTLAQGNHSITATATDVAGNVSTSSAVLAITIDTTAPTPATLDLEADSDTGMPGDHLTTLSSVTFEGTTSGNAAVELRRGGVVVATGTADAEGDFTFSNVTLPFGASSFQVIATDAAGNSSTSTSQSFTRNSAPVVADQGFDVDENRPAGFVVDTVAANDANMSDGDTLTYSIIAGNSSGAFAINSSTGQITVANPAAIDFETTTSFALTVRVTDHGGNGTGTPGTGLSDEAVVTINVNDLNDPPVVADQGFSIAENSADETVVGVVAASDQDPSDTLTYAITGGNTDGAFEIDAQTGQIRVANSAALDYETVANHAFSLTVTVTDAGMLTDTATVIVTLTDANDRPTAQNQQFNVSTKYADGTVIDKVEADDQDAGDTLTYTIESNNAPEGVFSINASTGELSVTNTDTLTDETYLLTIQVTDEAGATLVTPITITLNVTPNFPPQAKDDAAETNEDTAIDIDIFEDNGHGADADGDDPIEDWELTFDAVSAMGATITQDADGTLRYNPVGSAAINALAMGQIAEDTFTYTIRDPGGLESTATVTVTLTGVNDNPTANADAVATDEDTAITFNVLADNGSGPDSDPDMGDVLTVTGASATSAQGATITFNANGTVTYDPTTSNTLQALDDDDDPIVDTFTYTISDGKGGTSMATVSVTVSGSDDEKSFLTIADQNVFAGAPLLIPLNGADPDLQSLTFTAKSKNGDLLQPIVYSTSRSLSITLAGYGEMRFYLFEELVPGITQHIIDLVESGEVDNTIFHRLIEGFVAQGLDPTGTGRGHFNLPEVDDEYNTDLQHTGSGYLSMAKSGDDTNGQQIFITDYRPGFVIESGGISDQILRNLDFNHSVFGRLTLGESIRQAIMGVAVDSADRPIVEIVVEDISIVDDDQNAVLMLKAPDGMTGTTEVTVTVEDTEGNSYSQTFDVTVTPDTVNARPFLGPVPASLTTTVNQPIVVDLTAVDVEGDAVFFSAGESALPRKVLFDNAGDEAGVTPVGTGNFTYRSMTWTGGSVTTADASMLSSGTTGYHFGADGEIVLATASPDVSFFFTHGSGVTTGTATAYDAGGNVVETWDSNSATEFNDWHNFAFYNAERDQFGNIIGPRIARIEFTGGIVDNFEASVGVTVGLTVSVDNTNDSVTITPPAGFVGRMNVIVAVSKVNASSSDSIRFDTQVIPITVLPAAPLTAAEGGSGQAASAGTIGDDDPLLTTVFQSALAAWQSVLGLAELPDVQLTVQDLGGALLGSTVTLASDASGLPTSSVITIDDDGAGHGWHTSVDQSVAADRYDLYTVLLHEVGHALGFHAAAEALGLSDSVLEAYFDDYGHLLGETDDLMSDDLGLGERRLPSGLDIDILQLAYGIDDGDSSALDAALAVWN